jgi:YgiT-type zinc finger domain-containing protein
MEGDRCDFCGEGQLVPKRVREYYRHEGDLVVIDNVPAYVCTVCGEHYHVADVAKQLRRIAQRKHLIKETICFPCTAFDNTELVEAPSSTLKNH